MLGNKPDPLGEMLTEAESLFNNEFGLEHSLFSDIRIDLSEDTEQYIVTADLPGYTPEEIDVTVHENILTIETASHTNESEEETENYYIHERTTKQKRTVRLPSVVSNPEDVTAEYKNGVLNIEIPKDTPLDDTVEIDIQEE